MSQYSMALGLKTRMASFACSMVVDIIHDELLDYCDH